MKRSIFIVLAAVAALLLMDVFPAHAEPTVEAVAGTRGGGGGGGGAHGGGAPGGVRGGGVTGGARGGGVTGGARGGGAGGMVVPPGGGGMRGGGGLHDGGHPHDGGHHDGHFHDGRHHHHGHGGVDVFFGPDWWWGYPYYPYYQYPYYYPYNPPMYSQPEQQYQTVEPETPSYWYYCPDPQGYYPYINNCPKGWLKVVPNQVPEGEEGE